MDKISTVDNFDYSIISAAGLQKRKQGNQGRKNDKRAYKDLFCAFDIETTNHPDLEQAFMYIWQFQIEDQTIIGRTWMEFKEFMFNCRLRLKEHEYLMIYVHNLSFEFSFLKGIYNFKPDEVFSIESRKVLRCTMWEHFELRCSYLLTNMNLATFTKRMGVTEKLSGEEFDYSKIRYPWTELTDQELQYCIVDVMSLVEALKVYFKIENDNFYTIPFTSTGFVRRDVKRAMRHYNRQDLFNMQPDYEVFKILREAFAPMLPDEIVWRQKEQFSDGVGYSWIDTLKAVTAAAVSDEQMAHAAERFPINPPKNKEEYYYRCIFADHFPSDSAARSVPSEASVACSTATALEWDAAFRNMNDPSGRAVRDVHRAALP